MLENCYIKTYEQTIQYQSQRVQHNQYLLSSGKYEDFIHFYCHITININSMCYLQNLLHHGLLNQGFTLQNTFITLE